MHINLNTPTKKSFNNNPNSFCFENVQDILKALEAIKTSEVDLDLLKALAISLGKIDIGDALNQKNIARYIEDGLFGNNVVVLRELAISLRNMHFVNTDAQQTIASAISKGIFGKNTIVLRELAISLGSMSITDSVAQEFIAIAIKNKIFSNLTTLGRLIISLQSMRIINLNTQQIIIETINSMALVDTSITLNFNNLKKIWAQNNSQYAVYTFQSGNKYKGQWKNGQPNGFGILTYFNGDSYEGEWLDGQQNGFGIYNKFKNGSKYQGQWENGQKNGFGILTHPIGDKKIMTYPNVSSYKGEWKKNVLIWVDKDDQLYFNNYMTLIRSAQASATLDGEPEVYLKNILKNLDYNYVQKNTNISQFVKHIEEKLDIVHSNLIKNSDQIHNELIKLIDKPQLFKPGLNGHDVLIEVAKNKNGEVVLHIYNSGSGLTNHKVHPDSINKTYKKYKTKKTYTFLENNFDKNIVPLICNNTKVVDFYEALKNNCEPIEIDNKIYQTEQKSGNCGIESWMAYLKNEAIALLNNENEGIKIYNLFQIEMYKLAIKNTQDYYDSPELSPKDENENKKLSITNLLELKINFLKMKIKDLK